MRTDTRIKIAKVSKRLQANNGNQAKVAKELGVSRAAIGQLIRRHPDEFEKAMNRAGLSDNKLFKPIKTALEATKTANDKGEVYPSDEPDHDTRLKAAELAFKLKGRLSKHEEKATAEQHLHLHLGDKKTSDLLAEIKSQLKFLGHDPDAEASTPTIEPV